MLPNITMNVTEVLQDLEDSWGSTKTEELIVPRSTIGISAVSSRHENYSSAIIAFLNEDDMSNRRDSLYVVLPITVIYVVIFFTGMIGNIATCVVIARNRSMHTATNYYLFSLAVSDLLLLISGLPPEMYYIWSNFPYIFGEAFCIIQSFAAETSANATVLTITAFTVERYVAICHPFISHTMSKLSRAVKFVVVIWLLALCLAIPQAIQFGIIYDYADNNTVILDSARCSLQWTLIEHAFEISTILFFVMPMSIITVLYVLIAIKLRRSSLLTVAIKRHHVPGGLNHSDSNKSKTNAQRNVIRMLIAVVVAFFICWAPFHAQRLLAVYAQSRKSEPEGVLILVYIILTYVSGVFYYLSTTVNPLLYNIMSNKFREAFKSMLPKNCVRKRSSHRNHRQRTYTSLSRYQRSMKHRFEHYSPSISVSDEQQRLTHIALTKANSCEPNGFAKSRNEQQIRSATSKETAGCREYTRSASRGSDTSQVTMMTSVSKQALHNEGNNNVAANECLLKIRKSPKAVTLAGILTGRLGFGTRGFFVHHRKNSMNDASRATKSENVSVASPPRFHSHPSIESANTISNSSLQDLDKTEFIGSELAQYMGELNFDLIT